MTEKRGAFGGIDREYWHPTHERVRVYVRKKGYGHRLYLGVNLDGERRTFTTLHEAVNHARGKEE